MGNEQLGNKTRDLTTLLLSVFSGAGAALLLVCTLLGVGTLNCGDGRSVANDVGVHSIDAARDALGPWPGTDAPVGLDGLAGPDGPAGKHPCEPICELLNVCGGGSSKSSGSGPGSPGWLATCVASCLQTYAASTPGSLSGGKSSYRQKIDCGAMANSCAGLKACLE